MGVMDAFERDDRAEVKVTALYQMLREAAKCELLMNAVNCDVPHMYIREMATGEAETPVTAALSKTVMQWMKDCEAKAKGGTE